MLHSRMRRPECLGKGKCHHCIRCMDSHARTMQNRMASDYFYRRLHNFTTTTFSSGEGRQRTPAIRHPAPHPECPEWRAKRKLPSGGLDARGCASGAKFLISKHIQANHKHRIHRHGQIAALSWRQFWVVGVAKSSSNRPKQLNTCKATFNACSVIRVREPVNMEAPPASEETRKRVEAAKSYIENMYKQQNQNIQERYAR